MKKDFQNGMNFLEKKEVLKDLIFEAIGVDSDVRICKMLRHLWGQSGTQFNKFGEKKLTNDEFVVAQILKRQKTSPRTAYRWFLLCKAPKEALDLTLYNKISMNNIAKQCRGVKRTENPAFRKFGKQIIKEIIEVVEVL